MSEETLYKVAVVLTAPFWLTAVIVGAICGAVFVGFTGGFAFLVHMTEKKS